ncbi:MAG: hypothetical protein QXY55_06775 [Candidatus Korarchaeota archaeon]|nr:hypothetical protein [Thermoproteota archaeon]
MIKAYRKLGEVITERINKERKSWYRKSKTVEASMHMGLTAIGSGIASYLNLPYPELASLISILFTGIGILIGFQERIQTASR